MVSSFAMDSPAVRGKFQCMMIIRKIYPGLIVIALLFMATSTGAGVTYWYPEIKPEIMLTLPSPWTVRLDEPGFRSTPPDEKVTVFLWSKSKTSAQKVQSNLSKEIAAYVTDFQIVNNRTLRIHRIPLIQSEGTGRDKKNQPVNVTVGIFSPNDLTVYILLEMGSPEAMRRYAWDLHWVIRSVRQAK